ncbi:MFS transporter [Actinorugispora endophytica]|uniref:Putative MFS family arabinose efflux permease n=1 Tax=Actinorugispora endophytica TaxID=1605990 RepID=A0A4R6V027_9ACTN|nr:MFS transporter [Actinorugispora endophytica]TDQ53284.1 putative MFS family arabinose efflux permease [Actinorugispora endophytica]
MPTRHAGLPRAARGRLAGGFLLFLLSSFGQTFFVSLFSDDIRADHGLSHGGFGSLFMLATLAGALALTRVGGVVDRWSARTVVLVSVPALALGAAAMALATHVLTLFLALFVLRLFGQGMMTHTSFTLMGRWFDRGRGRATSVAALGLNAGEALLPLAVVAVAAAARWREVWWLAAAAVLLSLWPLVALLGGGRGPGGRPGERPARGARDRTRREALRDPGFHLLVAAMAAPALVGNTVFFHQAHLGELRGWPPEVLASAFTAYAAVTVVANLAGGHLVDRFTALRTVPFYLLPLGCGLLVLAAVDEPWGAFAFMALYGVTNGLSLGLFGAVWPEMYGTAHLGAIRSVVVAVLVFASAAGPGVTGLLIDAGVAYPPQVAALGAYCLAASLAAAAATRARRGSGSRPR